jgi:hypothetical protein
VDAEGDPLMDLNEAAALYMEEQRGQRAAKDRRIRRICMEEILRTLAEIDEHGVDHAVVVLRNRLARPVATTEESTDE